MEIILMGPLLQSSSFLSIELLLLIVLSLGPMAVALVIVLINTFRQETETE